MNYMIDLENNVLEFVVVDTAVLVKDKSSKTEEIEEVPSLVDKSITEARIGISSSVLAEALSSEDLSWHFDQAVFRIKVVANRGLKDSDFDQDFRITANITLKNLLEKEDQNKFSVLIDDLKRPNHKRASATTELVRETTEKIKDLARKAYSKQLKDLHNQ